MIPVRYMGQEFPLRGEKARWQVLVSYLVRQLTDLPALAGAISPRLFSSAPFLEHFSYSHAAAPLCNEPFSGPPALFIPLQGLTTSKPISLVGNSRVVFFLISLPTAHKF